MSLRRLPCTDLPSALPNLMGLTRPRSMAMKALAETYPRRRQYRYTIREKCYMTLDLLSVLCFSSFLLLIVCLVAMVAARGSVRNCALVCEKGVI